MLLLSECLDMSGLSGDELDVIREHESLPDIVAAELGCELLKTPAGVFRLHRMFLDVLEKAKLTGHAERARQVDRVYAAFRAAHPLPRLL